MVIHLDYGSIPTILGPLIISATTEGRNFKEVKR